MKLILKVAFILILTLAKRNLQGKGNQNQPPLPSIEKPSIYTSVNYNAIRNQFDQSPTYLRIRPQSRAERDFRVKVVYSNV